MELLELWKFYLHGPSTLMTLLSHKIKLSSPMNEACMEVFGERIHTATGIRQTKLHSSKNFILTSLQHGSILKQEPFSQIPSASGNVCQTAVHTFNNARPLKLNRTSPSHELIKVFCSDKYQHWHGWGGGDSTRMKNCYHATQKRNFTRHPPQGAATTAKKHPCHEQFDPKHQG